MAKKTDKDILLVAVDFSPYSEQALCFAGELADKLKAQLVVLHVIHDPAEAPGFYAQKGKKKKFLRSMQEAAGEMMEDRIAHIPPGYSTVKVTEYGLFYHRYLTTIIRIRINTRT